ncbi:MAG: nitroreductase family protein, partial [Oscillospiraceae bacterium]
PIDRDTITKLVSLSQLAPTWKNTQTTRFTAITDKAVLSKIADTLGDWNRPIVGGAPLLMAVSTVTKKSAYHSDGTPATIYGDAYTNFDCGAAVQTFCLAAHDMGIGTTILGMFDPAKVSALIGIPEGRELIVLISCGYSNETPPMHKRLDIAEVLKFI